MKKIVISLTVCFALSAAGLYSYGQELKPKKCAKGKWGYKERKTGEMVIPCKYDKAFDFHNGLAAVKLNEKWGYIDKTGVIAVPFKYDKANFFLEGLAAVKLNDK